MPFHSYPYELPPFPYTYQALEPYIDAKTMQIHHDKHFQACIDNLNTVLEKYPKLQKLTLKQLLTRSYFLPEVDYIAIMHHAGGIYNHMHYFEGLSPADGERHKPYGLPLILINKAYGSLEAFQEVFTQHALAVLGSGWVCLGLTPQKRLKIVALKNNETILAHDAVPVLLFDMWEHAYYLKHQNRRAEYLNAIWRVATWLGPAKLKQPREQA